MARTIMSLARGDHLPDGFQRKVTGAGRAAAERIAAAQERQVAYVCPDGTTRNKDGVVIERTRDMIPYSFRQEGEFETWLSDLSIPQQ